MRIKATFHECVFNHFPKSESMTVTVTRAFFLKTCANFIKSEQGPYLSAVFALLSVPSNWAEEEGHHTLLDQTLGTEIGTAPTTGRLRQCIRFKGGNGSSHREP